MELQSFYARYKVQPAANGCMNWTKAISCGYGIVRTYDRITRKKGAAKAHRFAYSLKYGAIPSGAVVCHACDNSICVNPDHMFLGTHRDNTQDALRKRRLPTGERSYLAKLTSEQVAAIRIDPRTQREIASDYGIHRGTVSKIKTGSIWRHD